MAAAAFLSHEEAKAFGHSKQRRGQPRGGTRGLFRGRGARGGRNHFHQNQSNNHYPQNFTNGNNFQPNQGGQNYFHPIQQSYPQNFNNGNNFQPNRGSQNHQLYNQPSYPQNFQPSHPQNFQPNQGGPNHYYQNQDSLPQNIVLDDNIHPVELEKLLMPLFLDEWAKLEALEGGISSALQNLVDNVESVFPVSKLDQSKDTEFTKPGQRARNSDSANQSSDLPVSELGQSKENKVTNSGLKDKHMSLANHSLDLTSVVGSEIELKKQIIMLQNEAQLQQLEFDELKKVSDEMVVELEASFTRNVQNGNRIKKLEEQLSEYKLKLPTEDGRNKEIEEQLDALNLIFETEREKFQKATANSEKELQEARANLTTFKEESEKETEDLLKRIDDLSEEKESLINEMASKEKNILECMKGILREYCECYICLSVLDKAVTTTCGHTFCLGCITEWNDHNDGSGACPNCRQTSASFRKIHFFDNFILKLKEKFPHVTWTKNQ